MAVKESYLFERMRQRRAEGRGTYLSSTEMSCCGNCAAMRWIERKSG